MKHSKFYLLPVLALWLALTAACWFGPTKEVSEAERRPLTQLKPVTLDAVLGGSFMENFSDAALDQFPLRQSFRGLKSLFHTRVLGQRDNNGIYFAGDQAVKQEYPLHQDSLDHAAKRFSYLYETYLAPGGCNAYMAVVPDKGQYLAEGAGQLRLDLQAMTEHLREALPWAQQIDLTDSLSGEDYYRTDIHWRQERLFAAAGVICDALGTRAPRQQDYQLQALERPFYGVYYGQAALPMDPDTMYLLQSPVLDDCTVYDYESGATGTVYDLSKLESPDLYDVFLSGPRSLLTVENPAGEEGRELVIFRDSFGSSIAPLLLNSYSRVTLVDIRYIQPEVLGRFLTFRGQDVLFLYSTPVLNNSSTLK